MGNRNLNCRKCSCAVGAGAGGLLDGARPGDAAAPPAAARNAAKVRPSEIIGRWGYAAYHKPRIARAPRPMPAASASSRS